MVINYLRQIVKIAKLHLHSVREHSKIEWKIVTPIGTLTAAVTPATSSTNLVSFHPVTA